MNIPHTPVSPEFVAEIQGKALEAFSVVADMHRRLVQGLAGLSATTTKEGLRACAEMQSASIEAARAAQRAGGADAPDAIGPSPFAWYQKGLLAVLEGTHQAFRLLEANAEVVTRSAERLQASAEQAAQEIQETLTTSLSRLTEIYSRS